MKCQKCGKESQTISTNCPFCSENYSLASVLSWVISERGEDILTDSRSLKSIIMDLCRDPNYDPIVFEGLLNQDFSKKIKELHNYPDFENNLESYCEHLSTTYNLDKINYIANSFYYALTGKKMVFKKTAPAPVPADTPKTTQSSIQYTIPTTKSSPTSVQTKKISSKKRNFLFIGIAGLVALTFVLIVAFPVIFSVSRNIIKNKTENTTPYDSSYENTDYDDEDVYASSDGYLTEDSISDVVQQGSIQEYYIKVDKPGVYRLTATDRTANYNVYIKAYDFNDYMVLNTTNEGSCTLENMGTYKITVETDSPSCSYTLNINRPNAAKTISKETPTVHDAITYVDQCNVYTFSAPVSGRYRVDCLNRTDGYNLQIEIYNSNNERVFRETNGGYLDMQQNVVYSIRVAYSTGMCEYDIKVSVPNNIKEISSEEKVVADQISFANQINTYTYIAPVSGKYRFEIGERTNGYNVQLRIYDANNNRIVRETNSGTVDMEKGVMYRIEIEYDTELCSYVLVIGVPNEIVPISVNDMIPDSISYVHQENRYTFTPGTSGEYIISTFDRTNDYNVQLYVFDANNNRVLREYNEGKVTLTAGTLYTVYVCYIDNLCDYTLAVTNYYGE